MISFVRVDNRLIHGQVIEAWVPHLKVTRILVADDQASSDPFTRSAMALAVPERVAIDIQPLSETDFRAAQEAPDPTLVLFRDLADFQRARALGLCCPVLNLGNVHFGPGRVQITPSVFLSPEEVRCLRALAREGVAIEVRAVPRDRPVDLAHVEAKIEPGSG